MTEPIEHNIEDEFELANHILLRRINDVLMLLLRNANPEEADQLANLHTAGIFISPPLAYAPGEDE